MAKDLEVVFTAKNHRKGPTRKRCAVPDDRRFLLPLQPPQARKKIELAQGTINKECVICDKE